VCYNTQQAKAACSCFEVGWIRHGTMGAVGVDILDGDDGVIYCLVLAPCSMTNGTIDAANCYSLVRLAFCDHPKERVTHSTRITSTGNVHLSFSTAHRRNCSLVTDTPTLQSALSSLAVTPGGAASWITFNSFSGSTKSEEKLNGSGSLLTSSRFSNDTKICLSCEKVELHECL